MGDISYTPFYAAWHNEPVEDTGISAAALAHFDQAIAAVYDQANIGAHAADHALFKENNLSDVLDAATALTNLGGAPAGTTGGGTGSATGLPSFITPETYGAKADGSDDGAALQAAIDACNALPHGGILVGDCTKIYTTNRVLIWKSGVKGIFGPNIINTGSAKHSAMIVPGASFPNNSWVIDTTTAALTNASIVGLAMSFPIPTSSTSPRWGGIRIQLGSYVTIAGCVVGGTSLQSIYVVNGVACLLENLGVQQFTTYRTLTTSEGALDVGGTDHTIRRCQCNGGDNTRVYDPVNYYRCGFLLRTLTSWVYDVNGEYADCGVKILGSFNRLYGVRGDVNAGCGVRIEGGSLENMLYGVLLYANSNAAVTSGIRGEHDGIYVDSISLGNIIDGVVATTLTAPVSQGPLAGQTVTFTSRYIVNDQANPGTDPRTAGDGYTKIGNVQAPINTYEIDKVKQSVVFESIDKPRAAAGAQFRPPSRRCAGATMANSVDHHAAYSDGQYWRSTATDLIVGNRMDPDSAVPRETATWLPYLSTATAAIVNGEGGSLNKANTIFKVPRVYQVKCTSSGASGGSMGVISALFPVEAGNTYTLITSARGVAKAFTLTPTTNFYDAAHSDGSGAGLGAAALGGLAVAQSLSTPTECIWTGIAAPTGAAWIRILFTFTATALAVNDTAEFALNCVAMTTDTVSGKTYTVPHFIAA